MMGMTWTEAENDIIRALIPASSWPEILAALPNRSRNAISMQASVLKVKRRHRTSGRSTSKPWMYAEIKLLEARYFSAPWEEIARLFPDRSLNAVRVQACQRGLTRQKNLDRLPDGRMNKDVRAHHQAMIAKYFGG